MRWLQKVLDKALAFASESRLTISSGLSLRRGASSMSGDLHSKGSCNRANSSRRCWEDEARINLVIVGLSLVGILASMLKA